MATPCRERRGGNGGGDGQNPRFDTTRNRILAAAAATLSAKDYSESRLSDIAMTAGLRTPAVYYYFPSRDDLIAEVMRVGQVKVREHVEEAMQVLPPSTLPLDKVAAAVEAHLRVQLELSDLANAVTRNAGHVPPLVRDAVQRESEAYHSVWRELLLEARLAGQLRPDLDETIARMLVIGALNWATSGGPKTNRSNRSLPTPNRSSAALSPRDGDDTAGHDRMDPGPRVQRHIFSSFY